MTDVTIHGTVEPGFEAVREAFAQNFREGLEVGGGVCIYQRGKVVVDLWAGHRDAERTTEWTPDTIATTYSNGKGWLATCMNILVDRGVIELDQPIAKYWPAFSAHGKDKATVRHALTHSVGLPAPSMTVPDDAIYDFEQMLRYVADSELFWEPGTQTGYHAATFGWINGGILFGATGMTPGEFLRREIREPLGADLFWGLTPAEDPRVATFLQPVPVAASTEAPPTPTKIQELSRQSDMLKKTFNNPPRRWRAANTVEWRRAIIPASNGYASARGLARMYAALGNGGTLDGVTLMRPETVRAACTEQVSGIDAIQGVFVRRGFGYSLPTEGDERGPGAFGHGGLGGSLGYADLDHGLGFGYIMNQAGAPKDPRAGRLSAALYASLGVAAT